MYGCGRGRETHSDHEYDRDEAGSPEFTEHILKNENPGFRFMLQFGHHYIETNGEHYASEIFQCYIAHCMMTQLRTNLKHRPTAHHSELQYFIGRILLIFRLPAFVVETFATFGLCLPPDLLKSWGDCMEAKNGNRKFLPRNRSTKSNKRETTDEDREVSKQLNEAALLAQLFEAMLSKNNNDDDDDEDEDDEDSDDE